MTEKFYEAWQWLSEHPIYQDGPMSWFIDSLDINVVKVNPATNEVDEDDSLNTKAQVWLESGAFYDNEDGRGIYHDTDLDVGGDTFEDAIIALSEVVRNKYGDSAAARDDFGWFCV